MNVFSNITRAATFTTNEIALFYMILQSWNDARRPAVIEQWAETTCHACGMNRKALTEARNKLVQKNILYFDKRGNRGVPRYSLCAIFGMENPFTEDLRENTTSKPGRKTAVNRDVKLPSYQSKSNKGEKEQGARPLKFAEETTPPRANQPTLEQVRHFAKCLPMPIPPDCAEKFFYDLDACSWVDNQGRCVIARWKSKLQSYAISWRANETRRPNSKNNESNTKNYAKKL